MKAINTRNKYLIDCQGDTYRIGDITGKVPKDHDCILDGWHLKDGKVIGKGQAIFVPGNGDFKLTNSIVESARKTYFRFPHTVSIVGNLLLCFKGIFIDVTRN